MINGIWSSFTSLDVGFLLFIGITVSFDVAAMTLSQHKDFQEKTRRPIRNAFLHASWHAILFAGYMFAILFMLEWLQAFSLSFLGVFNDYIAPFIAALVSLIPFVKIDVPETDLQTLQYLIDVLVFAILITFIWVTYASKIVENHRGKTEDPKKLLKDLRFELKVLFSLLQYLPWSRAVLINLLAATVAVDMLAVSAATKSDFIPIGLTGGSHGPEVVHNIAAFAIGIFMVVWVATWLCGLWASSKTFEPRPSKNRRARNRFRAIVLMRLAEPLCVFTYVAHAIATYLTLDQVTELPTVFGIARIENILFGLGMTTSLVVKHGCKDIYISVRRGVGIRTRKDRTLKEDRPPFFELVANAFVGLFRFLISKLGYFLVVPILAALSATISMRPEYAVSSFLLLCTASFGIAKASSYALGFIVPIVLHLANRYGWIRQFASFVGLRPRTSADTSIAYNWRRSFMTPESRRAYLRLAGSRLIALAAVIAFVHIFVDLQSGLPGAEVKYGFLIGLYALFAFFVFMSAALFVASYRGRFSIADGALFGKAREVPEWGFWSIAVFGVLILREAFIRIPI